MTDRLTCDMVHDHNLVAKFLTDPLVGRGGPRIREALPRMRRVLGRVAPGPRHTCGRGREALRLGSRRGTVRTKRFHGTTPSRLAAARRRRVHLCGRRELDGPATAACCGSRTRGDCPPRRKRQRRHREGGYQLAARGERQPLRGSTGRVPMAVSSRRARRRQLGPSSMDRAVSADGAQVTVEAYSALGDRVATSAPVTVPSGQGR